MEEPTFVLLRFHDSCASLNLSLIHQVEGMKYNSPNTSYADLRSPSRARHHSLRKRQTPTPRWKRCHPDCIAYEHLHLSSRHRRMKEYRKACSDSLYQDKTVVEQEHTEFLSSADPIRLYYDFGHNAPAMNSLRPSPTTNALDASFALWRHSDADAPEKVINEPWTLYLYSFRSCTPLLDRSWLAGGDCTFTWHRNYSGCWELGHASQSFDPNRCTGTEGAEEMERMGEENDGFGCMQAPLMCMCCLSGRDYDCACAEFTDHEPSPEDCVQGALVEWMRRGACDVMAGADAEYEAMRQWVGECSVADRDGTTEYDKSGAVGPADGACEAMREWTFIRPASRAASPDWDLVSMVSSTGSWRVVDVW